VVWVNNFLAYLKTHRSTSIDYKNQNCVAGSDLITPPGSCDAVCVIYTVYQQKSNAPYLPTSRRIERCSLDSVRHLSRQYSAFLLSDRVTRASLLSLTHN
jgi:hypothetical protein